MSTTRARISAALAALIVVGALVVRLHDLERRGLNHPENYVPGIPMPAWVNLPPPRTTFPLLLKSILKDAHPPLYYLAMYPWAKAFGISTFSLRLPSAILGAASIFILWRLALREMGRVPALVAATLLALHGTHIYWSQTARMYSAASFFSLLSTLMLWKLLDDGRLRYKLAYGASAILALWTQIYCWPVLLGQVIWSSLRSIREKRAPVALPSQFAAVILSMPVIALTVYQWRPNVVAEPMREYFEFGYLFWSEAFTFTGRPALPAVLTFLGEKLTASPHIVVLAVGLFATVLGLVARPLPAIPSETPPGRAVPRLFYRLLIATGALVSLALAWAAQRAFPAGSRQFVTSMAIAALPLAIALSFPAIYAWSVRLASRDPGFIRNVSTRILRVSPVLALLPVALMMVAGSVRDVFVARGAMIYVPYLLLLAAAGLVPAGRMRWLTFPVLLFVVFLHVKSVPFSFESEHSPRDYKRFAEVFRERLKPDDLILITNLYSDPPLLYYFPDRFDQFVPGDYESALAKKPGSRFWVVLFEDQEMNDGMRAAVAGKRAGEPATAAGARALLYLP